MVLRIFLLAVLLIFFCIILFFLVKKQLNLKYTLVWLLADVAMIAVVIFPNIILCISEWIGIISPVNTVFLLAGVFSFLIILTLTIIVSQMRYQLTRLAQAYALLEEEMRDLRMQS